MLMMKKQVTVLPVFGIMGSGKGTVIRKAQEKATEDGNITIRVVEMGACFRALSKTDNIVRDAMNNGGLLPDSFVDDVFVRLLQETLAMPLLRGDELAEKVVVLVDGYPRTNPQWENFLKFRRENNLKVAAVFLELPEEVVMYRSKIRRICPKCGMTFSVEDSELCPNCGTEGRTRPDDEQMKRRVEEFNAKTKPVIEEAKSIFEHQITVSGEDTKLASQQVWDFLQTL